MKLSQEKDWLHKFGLAPDIWAGIARFPVSSLIAIAMAVAFSGQYQHFFGLLLCSFFWSVALTLLGERLNWNILKQTLTAAAFPVIIFCFEIFWPGALGLATIPMSIAFMLLVGLAPYLTKDFSNNSYYWQFNHDIWIRAALSFLAAMLLFLGIMAILASIKLLFSINLLSEKLVSLLSVALASIYWLSVIPRHFDTAAATVENADFSSAAINMLVKYILVPLLLIYTLVLHIYLATILIQGVLPANRIGYMVTTYGIVGIITSLLAWPTRYDSGPLVRFFWKYWFFLLLGPAAMLLVAGWVRIQEYGVTFDRYILMANGLWLLAMAILFSLIRSGRNLKWITLTNVVLLSLTSIGPWGAVSSGNYQQANRLVSLLEQNNMLENGKLFKVASAPENKAPIKANILPQSSKEGLNTSQVNSILIYLTRNQGLDRLQPLLSNHPSVKFNKEQKIFSRRSFYSSKTKEKIYQKIILVAQEKGISRYVERLSLHQKTGTKFIEFNMESVPTVLELSDKSLLILPHQNDNSSHKLELPGIGIAQLKMERQKKLSLSLDGHLFQFDFKQLVKHFEKDLEAMSIEQNKFLQKRTIGKYEVTLHITHLQAYKTNSAVKPEHRMQIFNATYFLIIKQR